MSTNKIEHMSSRGIVEYTISIFLLILVCIVCFTPYGADAPFESKKQLTIGIIRCGPWVLFAVTFILLAIGQLDECRNSSDLFDLTVGFFVLFAHVLLCIFFALPHHTGIASALISISGWAILFILKTDSRSWKQS